MVSTSSVKPTIAVLTGPTATGKSAIALEFALERGGIELINADSLIVYRKLDIGTAKPTREELAQVPHHLVDIREPEQRFTAGEFRREALRAIQEIEARGKRALIVGGTGFYLKALLFGLWEAPASDPILRQEFGEKSTSELYSELLQNDPTTASRLGAHDRYRLIRALEMIRLTGRTVSEIRENEATTPDPRFRVLVIDRNPAELSDRISRRTALMLEHGLIDEVRKLEALHPLAPGLAAVGYAQVIAYLRHNLPSGRKIRAGTQGLQDEIELATRQLVKRQRTWFRSTQKRSLAEFFLLENDRKKLLATLRDSY